MLVFSIDKYKFSNAEDWATRIFSKCSVILEIISQAINLSASILEILSYKS